MSGDVLVWWRDDDAGRFDIRLDWLLALAEETGRAIGLAVVPAWLDAKTTERLCLAPTAQVLQHGWAHVNHAVADQRSIELGGTADPAASRVDLHQGASWLRSAFGDRFLPVMVPPWNRIDEVYVAALARLGFRGISTFADDSRGAAYGLTHVNAHVDLIDWRGSREMKPLPLLIDELEARLAQPHSRVVGLLSHHMNMSLDDMATLRQLLRHVDRIRDCRWTTPSDLFLPA